MSVRPIGEQVHERRKRELLGEHLHTMPQPLLGRTMLPETEMTYCKQYLDALTGFSLQSRNRGDLLWGRVQGTDSERDALSFIESELRRFPLSRVTHERFACTQKQWRPTACSLEALSPGETYTFSTAMTAFESAQTPPEGICADCVYVGSGTPSELEGRNLDGKIALLRADCYPNALLNSGRRAFMRIAETTRAVGVIVWWQIPGDSPVAGRVGTPMGGDAKGGALPWISISRTEGALLRRLLEEHKETKVRLTVRGGMEERESGHILGFLEGRSDKILLITMHVDGYFYAIHDNGAGVAIGMDLARRFSAKPVSERPYSMLFHFSGDHEVPGAGGSRILAAKRDIMDKVVAAYQIEHVFSRRVIEESGIFSRTNAQNPVSIFVAGGHKGLSALLAETAERFDIPLMDTLLLDPMGDIQGFYPPFASDGTLLSAGFIEGTTFYHTCADKDMDLLCDEGLARALRAHEYLLERSQEQEESFFDNRDSLPLQEHLFTSDYFKLLYSEF